jgi:hypothetical protein
MPPIVWPLPRLPRGGLGVNKPPKALREYLYPFPPVG